jgi:hypothetical protein
MSPSHAANGRPLLTCVTSLIARLKPRRSQAHARNRQEAWAGRIGLTARFRLLVVIRETRLPGWLVLMELPEDVPTQRGQLGLLVCQRAQQCLTKPRYALGENDPRPAQPPRLSNEGRTRVRQMVPDPMEGLKILLRVLLDQHETHRRPSDGCPNRLGIRHRMLVRFD